MGGCRWEGFIDLATDEQQLWPEKIPTHGDDDGRRGHRQHPSGRGTVCAGVVIGWRNRLHGVILLGDKPRSWPASQPMFTPLDARGGKRMQAAEHPLSRWGRS